MITNASKELQEQYPQELYRHVIAVTNRHLCPRPLSEQIRRVCEIHPKAVILREKDLPEEEYILLAREALDICKIYHVPCILHTYAGSALRSECTSIHLPLPLLRRHRQESADILAEFSCIGTSVHSVREALEARELGASYLTAGHIYATDCKKDLPPRGLEFLRQVCRNVSIPVYAIGGISPEEEQLKHQLEEVTACGAKGCCSMSGMMII